MANNYKKRFGDRADGRRIRSLNGFYNFIPFIMPTRVDALNYYEQAFDITEADRWFRRQRINGYKGMGMLHLLIASYVRACAYLPGLNRFVVGRRIYAHDKIEIVMAVKRSLTIDATETTIKVAFEPTDTIYDVYRKMNAAIDEIKNSDEENGTEEFATKAAKLPRFLLRAAIALLRVFDYFGILPVFIAFGAKRHVYELDRHGQPIDRKYIDVKAVMDERTVDGHYYATVFKFLNRCIADPTVLETPPKQVNEDIF